MTAPDAAGIEAALTAWFAENMTYEHFRDWDDRDFAHALLPVVTQAQAEAWAEGFNSDYEGDGWPPNPYRNRADESGGA